MRSGNILLLALSLVAVTGGCGAPALSSRIYIVAIDRSGSTDLTRVNQFHDIILMRQAALRQNAQMEIWYFDAKAQRIYGPSVPSDPRAVKLAKVNFLVPDAFHPNIGTRPDTLFAALDAEVAGLRQPDVRIAVFTDGDNDFPGDASTIPTHVTRLGAAHTVKLAIIGIHPENDAWWRRLVEPAIGGRICYAHQAAESVAHTQAISTVVGQ